MRLAAADARRGVLMPTERSAGRLDEPRLSARSVRCARCRRRTLWQGNPHRPFCSLTCRLLDLGLWLDEGHRIEGEPEGAGEGLDVP
jgi:hypothetical protein